MTTAAGTNPLLAFHWTPQPAAEALVRRLLDETMARSPAVRNLSQRLLDETGSRLIDWTDAILLQEQSGLEKQLHEAGFVPEPSTGDEIGHFAHPGGIFPRIGLMNHEAPSILFIRVESVIDFAAAWSLPLDRIAGDPLGSLRCVRLDGSPGLEIWGIERHGNRGFEPGPVDSSMAMLRLNHTEAFRTRQRTFTNDEDGFTHARELIELSIQDLGVDMTCDLFFAAEREYWQRRNRAAQFQKARQDRLGLGWANHDHHTYRSSREHFSRLVSLWERLGLVCRERFYAGAEAGWGAQVMEQPVAGIITFNDVDLSPDELMLDFAHEPLPPRNALGTVGLWCALHGEAVLQAGMHHLECQFDFDALKQHMEQSGLKVMPPFTDLPYLRQAFTEGERWPVDPQRIERALSAGYITREQAEQFRKNGAIGSHLENLQRDQGFKGFNQKGVSDIISRTDPRRS